MRDFISRCVFGLSTEDEIDGYIDAWHDGNSGVGISQFLGMTKEEYFLWVKNPDAISLIIENRKKEYEEAKRILE